MVIYFIVSFLSVQLILTSIIYIFCALRFVNGSMSRVGGEYFSRCWGSREVDRDDIGRG